MNEYDSGTEDSIDAENDNQVDQETVEVPLDVYQDAMQARNTLFMNETFTRAAVRRGNDRPCIADFDDLTCLCDGCMEEREQLIPNDD